MRRELRFTSCVKKRIAYSSLKPASDLLIEPVIFSTILGGKRYLAFTRIITVRNDLSWHGTKDAVFPYMSKLDEKHRESIPTNEFAFPKEGKEPIHDAEHVRNAIARFNQVQGVTDAERDEAWKRIKAAARKFNVDLQENDWREVHARR